MFYDILCKYGILILSVVLFAVLGVILYIFIDFFAVSPVNLVAKLL